MAIRQQISEDLKQAMKAGNKVQVGVLRLLLSKIKQKEIDAQRRQLDDDEIMAALIKQVKQHRESIDQYQQANRLDLVEKEQSELAYLQRYLPQPLDEAEIIALITDAMSQSGASQVRDMGKVMAILKPKVQGRADMKQISQKVRAQLQEASTL